jgi:serine/threonine-protein kinase RsbW
MTEPDSLADFSQTIKIKPETASLAEVRSFVEAVAADLCLEVEKIFDLKVAVSEACANAIKHAGRETQLLQVSALRRGGRLTFTITDNGVFGTPTPGRGDGERGLGLPLMIALMDEVTFTRLPGRGTTVSLSLIFRREEC